MFVTELERLVKLPRMAKITDLILILIKSLLLCYEEWIDLSQVKGVERMGLLNSPFDISSLLSSKTPFGHSNR